MSPNGSLATDYVLDHYDGSEPHWRVLLVVGRVLLPTFTGVEDCDPVWALDVALSELWPSQTLTYPQERARKVLRGLLLESAIRARDRQRRARQET